MIKKIFYSLLTISSFFFITDNVFAIDKINLYDFISDSKFDKTTFNYISNYPNLLDKFYFPFSSNDPEMIAEQTQPKDFLEYPLANGYNYYLILYKNGSFNGINGSKYDERRIILLFKDIPKGQLISDTCSVFMSTPSYKNSCSRLKFLNISDYLEIETVANKTAFSAYYFNNEWTITVTNSTVDTNTGSSVEEFTYTSYASNFDFYLTDGTKLVGASDIYYEVPTEDVSKGIWGTIKDIFNNIVSLPTKIIDGISSIISSLLDGIIDGLKTLFIPSDDFLNNWFTSVREGFEKQLGFLAYPITWILEILNRFLTLNDTGSYVISWSAIKVPNFDKNIIEAGSFDLATLLNNPTIKSFHDIYFVVIDSLFLLSFFNLCINAYNRCFGGDIDNYEYVSVDEGYTFDDKTGEVKSRWTKTRTTSRRKKA